MIKPGNMKTSVYKSLIAACVLGVSMLSANGQVLPAASVLASQEVTVNSTAAYLELENSISALGAKLDLTAVTLCSLLTTCVDALSWVGYTFYG